MPDGAPDSPPRRHALPHTPPDFVKAGSVFFITICALPRGASTLTPSSTWNLIQTAALHYQTIGRWNLRLLLAMPDHVHMLASFPQQDAMHRVIAAWKHYIAREVSVRWQRDFFDHRLRTDESFDEKAAYIRQNPVRAKLVATESERPCVWPKIS
jgi:putative transposase